MSSEKEMQEQLNEEQVSLGSNFDAEETRKKKEASAKVDNYTYVIICMAMEQFPDIITKGSHLYRQAPLKELDWDYLAKIILELSNVSYVDDIINWVTDKVGKDKIIEVIRPVRNTTKESEEEWPDVLTISFRVNEGQIDTETDRVEETE